MREFNGEREDLLLTLIVSIKSLSSHYQVTMASSPYLSKRSESVDFFTARNTGPRSGFFATTNNL